MLVAKTDGVPQEARSMFLCIDAWDEGEPSGRLYGLRRTSAHRFTAAIPLLRAIEELLDRETQVARFEQKRSLVRKGPMPFSPLPRWNEADRRPGVLATFSIRILFRQNATWQGEVHWVEGDRSVCFRSALELLLMIDDLMAETYADRASG